MFEITDYSQLYGNTHTCIHKQLLKEIRASDGKGLLYSGWSQLHYLHTKSLRGNHKKTHQSAVTFCAPLSQALQHILEFIFSSCLVSSRSHYKTEWVRTETFQGENFLKYFLWGTDSPLLDFCIFLEHFILLSSCSERVSLGRSIHTWTLGWSQTLCLVCLMLWGMQSKLI